MRFVSYLFNGSPTYGLVKGDDIHNCGRALAERYPTLRDAIAAGALNDAVTAAERNPAETTVFEAAYLPVIPNPDKIMCVGLNYVAHREESGRKPADHPTIFTRFAGSQVGHGQAMIKPPESDRFDFEGELAVIIGKAGRRIAENAALDHVAGYSCYNDGSIRDWQFHNTQWIPGKNFAGTGGFGPWMVIADEIPDPSRLTLTTRLNGETMQHSPTDLLIFPIPEIIAYVSTFIELLPGDVIATGTPGGVGQARKPPIFMKPGDTVEVDISGIGILRNTVAAEAV